ncbi:MAG TPA: hypothetical protein VG052_09530 [Puia sp.]|nr:hypothetical protein [Puia sp.]
MHKILCIFTAFLFFTAACKKHENKPPESSVGLSITMDPSIGTVSRVGSTDTFSILLKNPASCHSVAVVLHVPAGAVSDAGTEVNDSTWDDAVDISGGLVAPVTITAANGNSAKYGIAYDYVFTTYQVGSSDTVYPRAVYFQGDTMYLPSSAGLFVSTNSGRAFSSFTTANGLGDMSVTGVFVQGGVIYAATYGGLSISSDGGQHFANHPFESSPGSGIFYPVNAVYVQGDTIYAATTGGVWISRNGGGAYSLFANGLGDPNVLGISAQGSNVFAGTANGFSVSLDGGGHFTNYMNGLGNLGGGAQCNGFTINNGIIYIATVGGLSVSTNNGNSFQNYTTDAGLGSNWTNAVALQGSTVWVGTNSGLSFSTDGGASYSNFTVDNGLGSGLNDIVYGMGFQGSTVYAATPEGLTVITSRL